LGTSSPGVFARALTCPDLRTDGFTGRGDGPQVMDYMVSDLEMVIKDKACRLNPADIKAYMHMTLQAVAHCHKVRVFPARVVRGAPCSHLRSSVGPASHEGA